MTRPEVEQRVPSAILAAALLFNLGQGVLRPSMPLYLQRAFGADYRMVTYIPVVFGAGKWVASLPTGYLLSRLGRPLMILGLLLIAIVDFGSISTSSYGTFLALRALGGGDVRHGGDHCRGQRARHATPRTRGERAVDE